MQPDPAPFVDMKTPHPWAPCVVLVAMVLSAPALAKDTNTVSSLADYKSIYKAKIEQIERKCAADVARITQEYSKGLQEMMPALVRTADLDVVLAVKQEQTRVAAERKLPPKGSPDLPSEVVKLLDASRKAIEDAESEKTQSVVQLIVNYLNCLNTVAKDLLMRNEVKKALEAKAEIKAVEFELADARSKIITKPVPLPQEVVCRQCGGKRVIVTKCYYCKGTGKCAGCSGTGSVRKPGAKVEGSTFTHSLCKGTGKCPRCKGAGTSQEICPGCRESG